ncbi:hypothetical protein ABZ916_39085 [Streptomyces sp. NPDC046853]|uniref:hypothetical protein n=1 Tax=Streptomyces sp. NPDC046853 TaxID=3154920 RepID=UPI0033D10F0C
MTSGHSVHRDLAFALKESAKRTGEQAPSVRGADWRLATVTAVNGDGTVTADGITVRRMEAYANPAVGDVIRIDQSSSGNFLAMGRLATTAGTAWTAYTPTWTASTTNPTLGNGTLIGRYQRVGRTITVHINLTVGASTSVGSGDYSFALPVQAAAVGCSFIGNAHMLGASRWGGQVVISSNATTCAPFLSVSTTNPRLDWMTAAVPEAFGSGDQLRMTATYEAGS